MTLKQTPLTCSGHTRPVVDLDFSDVNPHGYFLISACKDGKAMLRQGDTGDWIGTFDGHEGAVWGSTLNVPATLAATGAADYSAIIWDAENGDIKHSFKQAHIVKRVTFSFDSEKLLTGNNKKEILIYNLGSPETEPDLVTQLKGYVKACLFSSDDRTIYIISQDGFLKSFDARTYDEITSVPLDVDPVSMELSRCGNILTVAMGKQVVFFNGNTLEEINRYSFPCDIYSASLHCDGNVFVCGGEDFMLYKCDYNTGEQLESYGGHFGSVHCVRFSPDGELYASGSEDGTVRLWQTTVGKRYGLWRVLSPENNQTSLQEE